VTSVETAAAKPPDGVNPYLTLRERAFGWGRARVAIPVGLAVVGPVVLASIGLVAHLPGPEFAALVLLPTPLVEALMALRTRNEWTAQEVLGWFDWTTLRDWRERGGGKRPRSPIEARAWLAANEAGSVPAIARASMLILAFRPAEARDAVAALPVATPREVRERRELELDADAFELRPLEFAAADEAIHADGALSPAERAVRLAYHAALAAVARGGDGLTELAAARPVIDRLPPDLLRRVWLGRLRFAVLAIVLEVWILVAILVALSTASGTVLY
jgi:hypothetical protein